MLLERQPGAPGYGAKPGTCMQHAGQVVGVPTPRRPDRLHRPRRIRRQRGDQPRHHRVRRYRPGQLRLGAQHRNIRQAVPAQRQRHHQISNDLPRVMHRPARPPPLQRHHQAPVQAGRPQRLGQQQRPALGHDPRTVSGHCDLGMAGGNLHLKSAFGWVRMDLRQAQSFQLKGTFYVNDPARMLLRRKAEAKHRSGRSPGARSHLQERVSGPQRAPGRHSQQADASARALS